MSSIALLGVPSEMYVYGTLYATITLSYPICMLITAHFYMPVFVDVGLTSSFEVGQYSIYSSTTYVPIPVKKILFDLDFYITQKLKNRFKQLI